MAISRLVTIFAVWALIYSLPIFSLGSPSSAGLRNRGFGQAPGRAAISGTKSRGPVVSVSHASSFLSASSIFQSSIKLSVR
jgi:hypothetical protein